jgi:hypothetical protein
MPSSTRIKVQLNKMVSPETVSTLMEAASLLGKPSNETLEIAVARLHSEIIFGKSRRELVLTKLDKIESKLSELLETEP